MGIVPLNTIDLLAIFLPIVRLGGAAAAIRLRGTLKLLARLL